MFVTNGFPFEEAAVMKFQGAVLKEREVTFAIVIVKNHVVENSFEADTTSRGFQKVFPGIPIVLMAQDFGKASFYGRKDIVDFLTNVPVNAIPWKEYSIT
ncbi:MAG TPA: hypothetical protein VF666_02075 [Pyrinomonadaceae bacterium]|jgi:hypothetical protein